MNNNNTSWIYVPKDFKEELIESNIEKMTLPQLKHMLREYKKDNPEILITGTKQVLINRILTILNQGNDVCKPQKSMNKSQSTITSTSSFVKYAVLRPTIFS